jgi:hypothetical protein
MAMMLNCIFGTSEECLRSLSGSLHAPFVDRQQLRFLEAIRQHLLVLHGMLSQEESICPGSTVGQEQQLSFSQLEQQLRLQSLQFTAENQRLTLPVFTDAPWPTRAAMTVTWPYRLATNSGELPSTGYHVSDWQETRGRGHK